MDIILSLLREAATIAFKALVKALASDLIKRHKDRTAPTSTRDGSDTTK